jgi:hypothetical protein
MVICGIENKRESSEFVILFDGAFFPERRGE